MYRLLMAIRPDTLPTDTAALTEMVLALDAENEKLRVAMQTLKDMIFGNSEAGAKSWAIPASLVNTAKLHDLDPEAYLADVLERIVSGRTKSHQMHELLA